MANLKRLISGLMAISIVATLGVSTVASAEDTQKTFYTGDVNLDGKVNGIDLIMLKKMILGIAPMQKMYIDGDTLKLVEDTQGKEVTIQATEYTINVENNTIHVTGIGDTTQMHDLTLKVTDNTIFSNEDIHNLEELSKYLDAMFDITYDDKTMEVIKVENIVMPPTTNTIAFKDHIVIINDDKTVSVKDLNLNLTITDDTVFTLNEESITFEDIINAYDDPYVQLSLEYNINTKAVVNIKGFYIDGGISYISNDYYESLYIDLENSVIKIPELDDLHLYVTNDTTFEGISSLSDIDDTYTVSGIMYNTVTNKVIKISAEKIYVAPIKEITICNSNIYASTYIIDSIEDNTINVYSTDTTLALTVNENTKYSGIASSLDDIKNLQETRIYISYNADTNVITSIDVEPIVAVVG